MRTKSFVPHRRRACITALPPDSATTPRPCMLLMSFGALSLRRAQSRLCRLAVVARPVASALMGPRWLTMTLASLASSRAAQSAPSLIASFAPSPSAGFVVASVTAPMSAPPPKAFARSPPVLRSFRLRCSALAPLAAKAVVAGKVPAGPLLGAVRAAVVAERALSAVVSSLTMTVSSSRLTASASGASRGRKKSQTRHSTRMQTITIRAKNTPRATLSSMTATVGWAAPS